MDKLFKPNQFYFVHCFDVLYHITDDVEWKRAIRNLATVSEKYIALHERFPSKRPVISCKHVKERSRWETINELTKYGFIEIGSIPTTVIRRLLTYKILGLFPNLYYKLDKFLLEKQQFRLLGGAFIKIFQKRIK